MGNNKNLSMMYSWPVIIVMLMVFWPVGIFLIIKRVSVDKKTALAGSKMIGKASKVLYVIAAIMLLACLTGDMSFSNFVMTIFFGIAGRALSKVAAKTEVEAEKTKKYLSVIVNGNIRSIDSIAAAVGSTYDVAKADIQKLITDGYLKNAYIDESTREVILAAPKPVAPVKVSAGTQVNAPTSKVVTCSCCGANNTIYGSTGECEYCGSPIG